MRRQTLAFSAICSKDENIPVKTVLKGNGTVFETSFAILTTASLTSFMAAETRVMAEVGREERGDCAYSDTIMHW